MALANYDGHFIEKSAIKIGLSDYGFSRGLAFFETMRVYGGKPFHIEAHLERMHEGAVTLGLQLPLPAAQIENIIRDVCQRNGYAHSIIKMYFTAGESRLAPLNLAADHGFTPHLIIVEDEMHPDHPEAPQGLALYQKGLRVKVVPHERALPEVKSISYMQAYYAAREAGPAWDDILFTHGDGYVTEATRANFFCVIDGELCTPARSILKGVTRMVVLDIARKANIPVAERDILSSETVNATEAFLSSSYAELVPIRYIDDHVLPTTMNGPVFSQVRDGYNAEIMRV